MYYTFHVLSNSYCSVYYIADQFQWKIIVHCSMRAVINGRIMMLLSLTRLELALFTLYDSCSTADHKTVAKYIHGTVKGMRNMKPNT